MIRASPGSELSWTQQGQVTETDEREGLCVNAGETQAVRTRLRTREGVEWGAGLQGNMLRSCTVKLTEVEAYKGVNSSHVCAYHQYLWHMLIFHNPHVGV